MTQAKIQPFSKRYILNLDVFNVKQRTILPQSVTQRNICLIIHNNHVCVIREKNYSTFLIAIKEFEKNLI